MDAVLMGEQQLLELIMQDVLQCVDATSWVSLTTTSPFPNQLIKNFKSLSILFINISRLFF